MPRPIIYLDNHSTTRTDPRVVEAMLPYFTEMYGNAASASHRFGWDGAAALDTARERVAAALGAEPREIVFTSGATESNNLAVKGVAEALERKGRHLITAATEHKAVLDPMKRLARAGWELTILPVDQTGQVDPAALEAAIRPDTTLVSIMAANNEIGTIHPFRELGRICHERGVVFHTDGTQAVGRIPLDVQADHLDIVSLSAHKFYGPKGIGALYIRRRDPQVRLTPLFDGGGHERGFRSGTPAVPGIVGLGVAIELAARERREDTDRIRHLRDQLHDGIAARVPAIRLNGHPTDRLAGNLNLSFSYVDGEALMTAMSEIAVSSGAACSSANPEPSHVLKAIGLDDDLCRASLRFGLGRFTTAEEVEFAIDRVAEAVSRLREQSPLWAAASAS